MRLEICRVDGNGSQILVSKCCCCDFVRRCRAGPYHDLVLLCGLGVFYLESFGGPCLGEYQFAFSTRFFSTPLQILQGFQNDDITMK